MRVTVLQGRAISGGVAEGQALVTTQPMGFLGALDPNTGRIVEKGHELEGQEVTGRVLVFPRGKGSTASPYILYAATRRGHGPAAIVNLEADPVTAVGAVMANIPLVDRLNLNPLETIRTGDWVRVDGDRAVVEIMGGAVQSAGG